MCEIIYTIFDILIKVMPSIIAIVAIIVNNYKSRRRDEINKRIDITIQTQRELIGMFSEFDIKIQDLILDCENILLDISDNEIDRIMGRIVKSVNEIRVLGNKILFVHDIASPLLTIVSEEYNGKIEKIDELLRKLAEDIQEYYNNRIFYDNNGDDKNRERISEYKGKVTLKKELVEKELSGIRKSCYIVNEEISKKIPL